MPAGFVVHSLIGFFLLHVIAWALSENRRTIAWRPVVAGMLLCFGLGVVLLKAPYVKDLFLAFNGALNALPLVLVVSALSALLFYWRVLPWIVKVFSFLLQKTMGVGGAIGLSSAANVFVGMVEAPLIVRPYIRNMSRGELFILMSCGMATVAGTVMALYAS